MNRRELLASPLGFCLFGLINGEKIKVSDIEKLNPMQRLCFDYINNIFIYLDMEWRIRQQKSKIDEPLLQPDERFMGRIEEKIDIADPMVDDFRRMVAAYIGHVMWHGYKFDWDSMPELKKAFELYMKEHDDYRD